MEIFLDTAKIDEIQYWQSQGVLDGVTTNPSIMLKDGGYDIEERAKEIARLISPKPLSVEVTTNDPDEMVDQARKFVIWADNIVIKIPVINEFGRPSLDVVSTLAKENIRTNVTACMSYGQVVLSAKAGATYVSIFTGRVSDEGGDPGKLIRKSVDWLNRWKSPSKIIVGSVRQVGNLEEAAEAGAHVLTIPPKFLAKWVDHHYSRATVRMFNEDAKKALQQLRTQVKIQPVTAR